MTRKCIALVAVVLLVGLSGCASVSVTAEIGGPDRIEHYNMNISTSTTIFGYLNEGAKEEGYDDLEDMATDYSSIPEENIDYSQELDGQDAHVSVEISDVDVASMSRISIREQDGQLVYEDTRFYNASATNTDSELGSGLVLEYTLEMPGEITDSNADEVDGNTATWTRTGSDAFTDTAIEATSKTGSIVPVHGFGVIPALAAVFAIGLIHLRRSNQ